jgi:hypothetical protein
MNSYKRWFFWDDMPCQKATYGCESAEEDLYQLANASGMKKFPLIMISEGINKKIWRIWTTGSLSL